MKGITTRQLLRRIALLAMLLMGCAAMVSPAVSQDLADERRRVLTVIGSVKNVDLPLQPLAKGLGRVFVQEVSEPAALSLMLHFTVQGDEVPTASWGIQVSDAAGKAAWTMWAGDVTGKAFWSEEVEGNHVRVEVYSARPFNPALLAIDKVAIRERKITPVSISGPNQLRSIVGREDWIVDLGRSVARVRFVGDDGGFYVCTAFLVTPELMLTNQHCISSQSEMISALIDFDYDDESAEFKSLRLRELTQADFALDYAVIRLATPAGRTPLLLDSSPPPNGEQLLIIQHPAGEPKQISLADCKVDGALREGRAAPGTDFGHQCDTKGGSSGSPVLRFSTRKVVGLHHLGISPVGSDLFNRAVHIDRVLADLTADNRSEIEASQSEQ